MSDNASNSTVTAAYRSLVATTAKNVSWRYTDIYWSVTLHWQVWGAGAGGGQWAAPVELQLFMTVLTFRAYFLMPHCRSVLHA